MSSVPLCTVWFIDEYLSQDINLYYDADIFCSYRRDAVSALFHAKGDGIISTLLFWTQS